MSRDAFGRLGQREFDLCVIGGGATGCGIARDAALRGFSVALVEKQDLASGTSSKSSKLIHGGLRYLEHAQFKLVFEGTNERALLLKRAPHLVRPLPFLLPAYKTSRPGLLKLDVGLWIYDGLSRFSSPRLHKTYRARQVLELEPSLRSDLLKGGIVYYDCLTDDARLTLENALDASALGAEIVNYAAAVELVRDGDRVSGVVVEDREPGCSGRQRVRARVTVNASGPWCDEVLALLGEKPILRPTKGVHLVFDSQRLPLRHAVVMQGQRDKRVIFTIPWGDRTVVGTTDTDFDGSLDQLYATAEDVDYLCETTNHYFPTARLTARDVLATWTGLRPLVAPSSHLQSESDTSREHHLIERSGFITIAGGKLTTYRRMAEEVVDRVGVQLGKFPVSTTAERSLPGAEGIRGEEDLESLSRALVERGISAPIARHLVLTYGVRAEAVAFRATNDPGARVPLNSELPYLAAEVDEAVRQEFAVTLSDTLSRRIPLLLRARDQGLSAAPIAAERMARRLGWSPARTREEVDRYVTVVEDSRRFRRA